MIKIKSKASNKKLKHLPGLFVVKLARAAKLCIFAAFTSIFKKKKGFEIWTSKIDKRKKKPIMMKDVLTKVNKNEI